MMVNISAYIVYMGNINVTINCLVSLNHSLPGYCNCRLFLISNGASNRDAWIIEQACRKLRSSTFEIDHIIARKHGGRTTASNLALSCFYCNTYKGPNLAGVDPVLGRIIRLFHPRRHKWSAHFRWEGPTLVGKTPIGSATIAVLQVNHPEAVAARRALIEEGVFPSRRRK